MSSGMDRLNLDIGNLETQIWFEKLAFFCKLFQIWSIANSGVLDEKRELFSLKLFPLPLSSGMDRLNLDIYLFIHVI